MRQTILTVVLVIAILATGWVWFAYLRKPSTPESVAGNTAAVQSRINKYQKLDQLVSDTTVLKNPLFESLRKPKSVTPTDSIPRGRANPFLPF